MMKKILVGLFIMGLSAFGFEMTSSGIKDGFIGEKYGKHGTQNIKGMPSLSLPLKWKDVPKGTKSFAIVMDDYDAIPVTGFTWIHWTAVVPGNVTELKENASLENKEIIQGVNSWVSAMGGLDRADASHFGGPAPPDKVHTYNITIYALDKDLDLKNGYYLNELYEKMEGHVLGKTTLKGKYKN